MRLRKGQRNGRGQILAWLNICGTFLALWFVAFFSTYRVTQRKGRVENDFVYK